MPIDFFVHPKSCTSAGDAIHDSVCNQYIRAFVEALEASGVPVVIDGLDNEFKQFVPAERHFDSASYISDRDGPVEAGQVAPGDWDRFVAFVDQYKDQPMRVHGCYYGQCTKGFAVQLVAHLILGEHWHNWLEDPDPDALEREQVLENQFVLEGHFLRSQIRYGIVMHPPGKRIQVIGPNDIAQIFPVTKRFPNGNIHHQLMDDRTVIHGGPRD